MSASLPGARAPFWGYMPKSLAGCSDSSFISWKGLIRPVAAPQVYIRTGRCSTPGIPLGILEKSVSQIEYADPVSKIVKITKDEDGFYGISDADYADLENYLIQ